MHRPLSHALLGILFALLLLCSACGGRPSGQSATKTYIVISDIHLGDPRAISEGYGWNATMKDTLMAFLDYLRDSNLCDELVLAGDIIDEWVAPRDYPAFADTLGHLLSEQQFFQAVVEANRPLFDRFQALRNSGVKLVYVPGNHDMQVTSDDFAQCLPGLFDQARSTTNCGMGEYCPTPDIFIEHGHRYDIMNAPYLGKNGIDGIQNSILPPGYFISKLACGQSMESLAAFIPDLDSLGDGSDVGLDFGWDIFAKIFGRMEVATHTDGMTRTYTFDDYAYTNSRLFNGIDNLQPSRNDGWKSRCNRLGTFFEPTVLESLLSGVLPRFTDGMGLQVLASPAFSPRLLVWGHSHAPAFLLSDERDAQRLYVNTGCWVDGRVCGPDNNAWFCKIIASPNGRYTVSLCRFSIGPDGQPSISESQCVEL